MTDAGDAGAPVQPVEPAPPVIAGAPAKGVPGILDVRAARRAALRDLAAMIGVEVFY